VDINEITCGDMVKKDANVQHVFFGFKRTIGRKYKDCELWMSAKEWPFSFRRPKNKNNEITYTAPHGGEMMEFKSQDLYVHLLRYMLRDVDIAHAQGITVTVPAHFDTVQRDATKKALRCAGVPIDNVYILNEPTAAAVAFLDDHREINSGRILIVDVGGGTVDCSLVEILSEDSIVIHDSKGTSEVGGEVITDALVSRKKPKGLPKDKLSLFRETIEEIKKRLSLHPSVTIDDVTITREELEDISDPMINTICDLAATVGGRTEEPLAVVLCGGTTRMPFLRKRIASLYPKSILSTELNPLTAVARGAALHAKGNSKTTVAVVPKIKDILTSSIGLRVGEDDMDVLVASGTLLPHTAIKLYKPMHEDQDHTEFVMYQGNHIKASMNMELGTFQLPPKPHEISVTIEEGGTIEIIAMDPLTEKQVHIQRVKIWKG
jgi:molecular chaperone DnaK (HSP70)